MDLSHQNFSAQFVPDASKFVRRVVGDAQSPVYYFLPWRTPYWTARLSGLLPLSFAACYDTPSTAVSSDPVLSVVTLRAIIEDATAVISRNACHHTPIFVGFSLGTVPATFLANRYSAPLLSICGAARGEDMIWTSPAAAHVKEKAEGKGYVHTHYYAALNALNPVENLARLDERSQFVIADKDRLIPASLRREWVKALQGQRPGLRIRHRGTGHVGTILTCRSVQREWLDLSTPGCTAVRLAEF